ncbi:MAG: Unknown protein [uncultured Thiotrichaceae bacterium]|uniref:Uncharacterized protein n=1 Tax=uncultured Thiotrichaceae bacterium TaxID=298394 RepID=A0A6S6TFF8_9GAMM|nr:MAG: Unknown protein [uncultured Thiotrichaceae bacterium]
MKNDRSRLFAYLETRLYWGEGVTANMLGNAFGLARQNAQKVISEYTRQFPDNIQYDASKKMQVMGNSFHAHYIRVEPERYLDYLRGVDAVARYWAETEWNEVMFEDIDRQIRPSQNTEIVKTVLSAIQNEQVISIFYQSKFSAQLREISPHHLVYAGRRYHVRAYCHLLNMYLDFVLPRILQVEASTTPWVSYHEDTQWNQWTDMRFEINPDLPEHVICTLQLDNSLGTGTTRTINTRQAMIAYIRREMERIDWKEKKRLWLEVPDNLHSTSTFDEVKNTGD